MISKKLIKAVLGIGGVAVTIFAFQNCGSSVSFSELPAETLSQSSDIPPDPNPRNCLFNGQEITDTTSVTAYQASSVPTGSTCKSEKRTCANGVLSGSFQYARCAVNAAQSCLFNGQTIASGNSVTAYAAPSVTFTNTCQTQVRTCTNGVLSGSYAYGTCAPTAAKSCLFNGLTVTHGKSVTAYLSSVGSNSGCSYQTRSCYDGTLSGSYQFPSCTSAPAPTPTPPPVTSRACTNSGMMQNQWTAAYYSGITTVNSISACTSYCDSKNAVCCVYTGSNSNNCSYYDDLTACRQQWQVGTNSTTNFFHGSRCQ